MVIHCYCKRLVRCTDGSNHQHLIVVIICERAREAGTQYTKRMLPWFVIPECNIRLDLVLELRKKHPTAGSARAHAYAVIGRQSDPRSASKGTPLPGWSFRLYYRASIESTLTSRSGTAVCRHWEINSDRRLSSGSVRV